MHHFTCHDGALHAEDVSLPAFADVPSLVCYALKANSNQAALKTLAKPAAGASVSRLRRRA
jgi:diaminopimelate decarboxylase